ncbi:MAG: hypothetical protein EXQ93_01855 [Alphaproteobacteria bacterium]|nr:hypothetical protein [Alphaproteobacteria bacterium]
MTPARPLLRRSFLTGLALTPLWLPAIAHAADAGGAKKADPNAPVFIKLQALNVTVFDRGVARGKLSIELQLEVTMKNRLDRINSLLPRLYDGYLTAVTEYSNSRAAADRSPDLDYLGDRFQAATDEAVGAGAAKVLFNSAVRTL